MPASECFWNPDALPDAIGADACMPDSQDRDIELLRQFRAGDREAFTSLYRAHQASVFRFAMLMTGDSVKAADITQDVFIWLVHHAENFDPTRGQLAAFLAGVARKFLHRRRGEELRWQPLDEHSLTSESARHEDESAAYDAAALRRAIVALPEKYREVVVRCDLEEKSYEEAAVAIGIAVGTVRSRLHRARALLARKLETQNPGRKAEKCPA